MRDKPCTPHERDPGICWVHGMPRRCPDEAPASDRLTPAQRATVERVRADGKAGIYYGPDALLAILDEIAPAPVPPCP